MVNLPHDFIVKMNNILGGEAENFFESYSLPPQKGLRVNTLKITKDDFIKLSPFALDPVEWEDNGFYITEEKPGKNVFHAAGLYYVQEPSAMCAAPMLEVKRGERVLDLCSAPGGKGTRLAQDLQGEGIIYLNEINFDRAKILSQNVERLGIKNAVVTCASPSALSKEFICYFDKILVDAPCSGEGMFKKEENAIPEWSLENVAMCAERQREILECAASMLKVGGRLVYSTCTFSEEEDEGQITQFLREHDNFVLIKEEKLYPHKVRGEGHFAAAVEKVSGEDEGYVKLLAPQFKDKKLCAIYRKFEKECLKITFDNLLLIDSTLYSLPCNMPKTSLQTLRAGVRLGEFKGDRFEPSHSLAMCLKSNEANCVEADKATAEKYLGGNTFECSPDLSGWTLVTHCGFPIGWCKAVNGTAKNHYPKPLRMTF